MACNSSISTITDETPIIEGSGNVITEIYNATEEFNKLTVQGNLTVYLKKGDFQNIEIDAEDNIMQLVKVEVKDGELIAKTESSISTNKEVNVYILYKDLNSISSIGNARIKVLSELSGETVSLDCSDSSYLIIDSIEAENLEVNSKGSSNIILKRVLTENISANLQGGSNLKIAGETKTIEALTSGRSDLYAKNLFAYSANISSIGSSTSRVHVKKELCAQAFGAADIDYYGNPITIVENKSGSATVKKR